MTKWRGYGRQKWPRKMTSRNSWKHDFWEVIFAPLILRPEYCNPSLCIKREPHPRPLLSFAGGLCAHGRVGQARIGFAPSDISARASTPLDERRRNLAIRKSEAKATRRKLF